MNFCLLTSLLTFLLPIQLLGLDKGIIPILEFCLYSHVGSFLVREFFVQGFSLLKQNIQQMHYICQMSYN